MLYHTDLLLFRLFRWRINECERVAQGQDTFETPPMRRGDVIGVADG